MNRSDKSTDERIEELERKVDLLVHYLRDHTTIERLLQPEHSYYYTERCKDDKELLRLVRGW